MVQEESREWGSNQIQFERIVKPRFKRWLRISAGVLVAGFLALNALAYRQAYAMMQSAKVSGQNPGVPNLAQVEPGVWRGGQPTEQGWAYLRSLGITNVVKLNTENDASDAPAKKLGMTIYAAPISLRAQLGAEQINAKDLEKALATVPAKGTYIHCEHGQDRTGLFVAMWRVEKDGWTKPQAEKEMIEHGFHKILRGLWDFWQGWDKEKK
jgi:hypothetical protein